MKISHILIGMVIGGCIVAAYCSPKAPQTYRVIVCRDQSGNVLDERMLKVGEHLTLYKGCEVEKRDFEVPN
jgi:hypothetical protein